MPNKASDVVSCNADNGGRTGRREATVATHLRAVRTDLGTVRRDDAESRAGHVHGDVIGGEVGTEPEVELDVSTSSARVAVDRNEELCVVVGSAARPTCRRQLDRHVDPQSPVLRPTRLHPTSSVTS